ncbi:MAG: magnesium-translocating P-type ATPase [Chitinispirillales bacterium]|jgi:Mg2+-importing ATPase|nr:magnesium-translocating P-type ATPase [Chitinispirillales bacterium]
MASKATQEKTAALTHKRERAKKHLLKAASRDGGTLLIQYDNSAAGYGADDVEESRYEHGVNMLTKRDEVSMFSRFVGAFINPFTIVLMALAVVSLFTDVVLEKPEDADYTAVIIIVVMVTISGFLRFIQELRSSNAAKRLTEMVKTTTFAVRKFKDAESGETRSEVKEVPMSDIVVGDVVRLAAGDMIPADVRIIEAKDLFISQSALTGESEPIEKFARALNDPGSNPLELNNLAFMGTNVISGSASAIVITVGDDTVLGSIAEQLQAKAPPTSFEKGVNSVSWVLIRFMLVMVPIVLLINGFTKGDWLQAFLFALSVAVGLTPEMLPMIVSANLAKGAVSMSRKRVIVKNLNSIQNFGAMDVLCTDKTGTITQDKVILELHLDIDGNDCPEVLRRGFLNSHYQTGLKNLMDLSIIEYARNAQLTELWEDYKKVDEIPFDFIRRRMSVAVEDKSGQVELITKGAIEEMLAISANVDQGGETAPLSNELREKIIKASRGLNEKGMRVLGLARKAVDTAGRGLSVADESGMTFVGYLAFLDPPKDSAGAAIKALNDFGVRVKVLTGDNDAVTVTVCKTVGLDSKHVLLGSQIEEMDDETLAKEVDKNDIFAKLSPKQKARIVSTLRVNGHTVGFMGDGINDAAAMKAADVGISVDTAVDIAKESANIILLEKDLMVLEEGVIEGRKTYANTIKYIKMTASANFGNMFSVLAASAFLPFLPMLPIQILVLNLIYDISCIAIPWDNVDLDFLKKPRKWDAASIGRFMLWIGPTSSVFDITTYVLMFCYICPLVAGGPWSALSPEGQVLFMAVFHTGWFVESLWSQTLVIHMIRTPKIPFIQSRASGQLALLTTLGIAAGTIIPYTWLGRQLNMTHLPFAYFPWLIGTIVAYMALATAMKTIFVRRYGELL